MVLVWRPRPALAVNGRAREGDKDDDVVVVVDVNLVEEEDKGLILLCLLFWLLLIWAVTSIPWPSRPLLVVK